MGTVQSYDVTTTWSAAPGSVGSLIASGLTSDISIPTDLGGPGVGTNPEELLLAAAAGCYLITLRTILTNRGVSYSQIELNSRGFVENDHGLRFDRIEHHPLIVLESSADEDKVKQLAMHAVHACMVSSALRGNVNLTVIPKVCIEATTS